MFGLTVGATLALLFILVAGFGISIGYALSFKEEKDHDVGSWRRLG